jgi:hypothetical protein
MRIAKIVFGWFLTIAIVYLVMVVGFGIDRTGWLIPVLVVASAVWLFNRLEVDIDIAREARAAKKAREASRAAAIQQMQHLQQSESERLDPRP